MSRMLIDARHSEETRVAIVKGNCVEEFDYESANKVQLKGNIYLAKVMRVEPSLQAAFVDYGGNRHGFLAFSEIHPDYYQIPVEDRTALLEEEAEIYKGAAADNIEGKNGLEAKLDSDDADSDDVDDEEIRETIRNRRNKLLKRRYKIQEVIKPKQILLIQIVKEERGNKGAAVTTYLSLAGRFTVLMPNTTHGGGISRKIANVKDRKRLKTVLEGLKMGEGMGCIIRTAGESRTKADIKRDVDYLLKLWDNIRALTLKSIAPCLIYVEGNLIKKAIRDLYDSDIEEILVEGEVGYKAAKEFMKLLMPSHAKKVQLYNETIPLFHRFQIEGQLDAMFQPTVTLKSGGYIVINPTEALIAVDVNSGRATKGHHIEETALITNTEAADELSRQLRLRDLSGLIVVDFIDMEARGHNRKVENRMRDAIKRDRARIQAGRISSLGLMELSRQRLRPNIVEASTQPCPHCEGTGHMRTTESSALQVIRAIEEEGIRRRSTQIVVRVPSEVGIYILNQKRSNIIGIESAYNLQIEIQPDSAMLAPAFEIQRIGSAVASESNVVPITPDAEAAEPALPETGAEGSGAREERPARRRRGRRGGRRRGGGRYGRGPREAGPDTAAAAAPTVASKAAASSGAEATEKKPRRGAAKDKPATKRPAAAASSPDPGTKAPPRRRPAAKKADEAKRTEPKAKVVTRARSPKKEPAKKTSAVKPAGRKTAGAKPQKPAATTKKATSKKIAEQKPTGKKPATKKAATTKTATKAAQPKPAEKTASKRKGWWQKG